MTLALAPARAPLADLYAEWMRREPLFAGAAVFFTLLALPLIAAMALDARTLQDVNVWIKPLKFTLSLAVYFGTLAWFAGWMRPGTTARGWYRWYARLAVLSGVLEMVWIIGAASFGVGSHFNTATPLMAAAYSLAGFGAVTLLCAAPIYAATIWRGGAGDLSPVFRASVVWGLALTFLLTLIMAGYLSAQTSHLVGAGAADAGGGAIFGWARQGGDLRPAHFFALHAMHFAPAIGLACLALPAAARRAGLALGLCAYCAFTVYVFAEALAGRPFLHWLA